MEEALAARALAAGRGKGAALSLRSERPSDVRQPMPEGGSRVWLAAAMEAGEERTIVKQPYTHRIAYHPRHTSPKMAAISAAPSRNFLAAFLPIARASLFPQHTTGSIVNRIPTFSHLRTALVPAAFLPIPGILDALWEGILKAVPKKKTSHM